MKLSNMIITKSREEIKKLRVSNVIVAEVLNILRERICDGITTLDLCRIAEEEAARRGGVPAFKGYRGFPHGLCTSVNDEVVHGIPGNRILKRGDIVSIDFGVFYDGYFGDAAFTVPVGSVNGRAKKLIEITEKSLYEGIKMAVAGGYLFDISSRVESLAEENGFSVVRDYVGHGIGTNLHEDPQIPNYGKKNHGARLIEGMVLAIEPMINAGRGDVVVKNDGWTAVTVDGSLSAHFEHSVAITNNGPYILSAL